MKNTVVTNESEETPSLRRSTRSTHKLDLNGFTAQRILSFPLLVKGRAECEEWNKAMLKEMESLKENDVVELPKDKKVVGSKWVKMEDQ